MRTLLLLRHGKAVAADPAGDHARALNGRGREQAATIATLLIRLGLTPDLALVSDSRRTRETADLALQGAETTQVEFRPELYAASAQGLLDAIRSAPDAVRRLIVIGHNPGIGEVARLIEGTGEPQAIIAMQESFPTASLAVFELDDIAWSEVQAGSGALTRFINPDDPRDG